MHFLLNHPHLREEIIETLKLRQHDADETVRYEVVMAIVETAKRDFQVVSESEDLLEYVKERTLDKKFKIRKEAMSGKTPPFLDPWSRLAQPVYLTKIFLFHRSRHDL